MTVQGGMGERALTVTARRMGAGEPGTISRSTQSCRASGPLAKHDLSAGTARGEPRNDLRKMCLINDEPTTGWWPLLRSSGGFVYAPANGKYQPTNSTPRCCRAAPKERMDYMICKVLVTRNIVILTLPGHSR